METWPLTTLKSFVSFVLWQCTSCLVASLALPWFAPPEILSLKVVTLKGGQVTDADVVVVIHGECVEYNPVSGKICVWTQSDLKSE